MARKAIYVFVASTISVSSVLKTLAQDQNECWKSIWAYVGKKKQTRRVRRKERLDPGEGKNS